jgi:hypothetical protein
MSQLIPSLINFCGTILFGKMPNSDALEFIITSENIPARYRCQMILPNKYKFTYSINTPDDLIKSDKDLTDEQINAMTILKPYIYSWNTSGCVRFIANEENINDAAKKYFTHIPQGWREQLKCPDSYEDCQVGPQS